MIKLIDNSNYGLITPFDICLNNYNKKYLPHYYDSFAMILDNGISYKDNVNTCMFKNCSRCSKLRKKANINLDKYLLDRDKIITVNSAFGGFALVKKDIFNKVSWGSTVCEHHYFCNEIKKLNKQIIIDPTMSVITNGTDNNMVDLDNIQKILDKYN